MTKAMKFCVLRDDNFRVLCTGTTRDQRSKSLRLLFAGIVFTRHKAPANGSLPARQQPCICFVTSGGEVETNCQFCFSPKVETNGGSQPQLGFVNSFHLSSQRKKIHGSPPSDTCIAVMVTILSTIFFAGFVTFVYCNVNLVRILWQYNTRKTKDVLQVRGSFCLSHQLPSNGQHQTFPD